jgi:PIN domain nuclease of toxin-antitoxin system
LTAILLDTHAWAWSLTGDSRLSRPALAAIAQANTVCVSAVSFFEIAQKVRLGKWLEMAPHASDLPGLLAEQGGIALPLDPAIAIAAGLMDWPHRDPFDRLLAATAQHHNLPIISTDSVFDADGSAVW